MPTVISSLHVYPVKGLGGIALKEAMCTPRGLEHDRRWMVVDREGEFLSQREHPAMATVWTDLEEDALVLSGPHCDAVSIPLEAPEAAPMRVRVWNSTCDALPASRAADAWLSDYLHMECRLVFMPESTRRESRVEYGGAGNLVGFADAFAYLIAGEASLADLNARLAAKGHPALPMNRFRPNIVVAGSAPYAEDTWADISIGDAVLRGVKTCGRCQVTTTDQSTGEVRGPEPLATLTSYRDSASGPIFGMNLVTVRDGRIRVGDTVNAAVREMA